MGDGRRWVKMRGMVPRPFVGAGDARAMQELASRLWPLGWHPGGLGWALARGQLADDIVLFEEGGALVGWAARSGVHDDGELLAQVEPSRADVAEEIAGWFVATADAPRLSIEVALGDSLLAAALERSGFDPDRARRGAEMFRRAERDPWGGARGYAIRPVRDDELSERVEVHRRAWRPASLPWADGRDLNPAAESSFTADGYAAVRQTWLYDPELDLVAVAPDGSLAGCCIAWLDAATGVAEIEPLGVAPEHRRNGVAVALCWTPRGG